MPSLLPSLLLLLVVTGFVACSSCPAETTLPLFSKRSVVIDSKYKFVSGDSSRYGYIYNYPLEMLRQPGNGDINTIITVHSFEWEADNLALNFTIRRIESTTAVLINIETAKMTWNAIPLNIFVNSRQYRPQLYFGESVLAVNNLKNYVVEMQVPNASPSTKFTAFITGVVATLANPSISFLYDIAISAQSTLARTLSLTVRTGSNTNLAKVVIYYVAYNSETGADFQGFGSSLDFTNLTAGVAYSALAQELVISDNMMMGVGAVRQIAGYRELIQFEIAGQLLVSVTVAQTVQALSLNYLGISPKASQICGNCPSGSMIVASGANPTTCEASVCPTALYPRKNGDGTTSCLSCPSQLNLVLSNNECACKPTFTNPTNNKRSKCLSMEETIAMFATMSVADANCPLNMVASFGGSCSCLPAYQMDAVSGTCVRRCALGIWQNNQCAPCSTGTYPWDAEFVCKPCVKNCGQCATENTCRTCASGFYLSGSQCLEICGDGRRYTLSCDDGNLKSGDGCSSTCEVELGYTCTRGQAVLGGAMLADKCTLPGVRLSIGQFSIASSMVILPVTVSPAPSRQFDQSEMPSVLGVSSQLTSNYMLFVMQDPSNLGAFRVIMDFMGTLPLVESVDVTVSYFASKPETVATANVRFLNSPQRGFASQRGNISILN